MDTGSLEIDILFFRQRNAHLPETRRARQLICSQILFEPKDACDGIVTCTACVVPAGPITSIGSRTVDDCVVGFSVIEAEALFVPSARLVALTITLCELLTDEGAVYNPPLEIVPAPLRLQLTEVLLLPVTVAKNCCDCPADRPLTAGVIETETGLTGADVEPMGPPKNNPSTTALYPASQVIRNFTCPLTFHTM